MCRQEEGHFSIEIFIFPHKKIYNLYTYIFDIQYKSEQFLSLTDILQPLKNVTDNFQMCSAHEKKTLLQKLFDFLLK